jgi:hypothetical protein
VAGDELPGALLLQKDPAEGGPSRDTGEALLNERVAGVQERIAAAARRAGRAPEAVTLVAVSKTWGPEAVAMAWRAGLQVFGENRVEEAGPKAPAVAVLLGQGAGVASGAEAPIWHMVGHVQSRKARDVLPWASMVHSVDSVKLAERLNAASSHVGRVLPILLEVNVSGEESKFGLPPADVPEVVAAISALRAADATRALLSLRLEGLMTIAPIVGDPEDARPIFRGLRALRDDLACRFPHLDLPHLSMGMTDDFEVAVEEGATMVRIGRAIFGERPCARRERGSHQ